MRNASNVFHGLAQVQPLAFGGGGECTGIQIADDGTKVMRTDTGNAYLRGPSDSQWTQLITFGASGNVLQANGQYNYAAGGTFEAAIAATNSHHILVRAMGYHYRSTDKGVTFSKLAILAGNASEDPNNGQQRLYGRRSMFDPAGTAVIVTTDGTVTTGGFHYSTDSGANFTKNTGVPAPTSTLPMMIAFDRSSSVVSGKTQELFVWSHGNGIYHFTTGCDGTPTLIANSNFTGLTSMEASGGKLWVCGADYDLGDVKSWPGSGSTWTTATASGPANVQAVAIAIDPTTSGGTTHIVAITQYGGYSASSDNGATWTLENAGNKAPMLRDATASEVPWHATSSLEATFLVITGLVFDPATAGTLWGAGGVGSWTLPSAPLTQGATKTWIDKSRGIENMGTQEIQVTPTGKVLIATQDRAVQVSAKSRVLLYPRTTVLDTGAINQCYSIDYAADDENYQVALTSGGGNVYISRDGGATWVAAAALPPGVPNTYLGGNVAVGNAGNIVYQLANDGKPYYTADHGATWTACTFGGSALPAGVVIHHAYYFRRRCLAHDKLGTFTLYIAGDGSGSADDLATRGVWTSSNGANFVRVRSTYINSQVNDFTNSKLKPVPGHSGHLFWATGILGSGLDDTAANVQLRFSSDGGVTWADAGIYEPEEFAISAAAPGCSYNTLYVRGYSAVGDKTTFGTFRCTNFDPANPSAATWVKLYDFPLGCFDLTFAMAGDPTQWDRFYEGKWGGPTYVVGYLDTAHMA